MIKNKIIAEINLINEKLGRIYQEIKDKNEGEGQFDYVSNASLGNAVDKLEEVSTKINRIVYQKSK